jgi:hypothetical protein
MALTNTKTNRSLNITPKSKSGSTDTTKTGQIVSAEVNVAHLNTQNHGKIENAETHSRDFKANIICILQNSIH